MRTGKPLLPKWITYHKVNNNSNIASQYAEDAYKNGYHLVFTNTRASDFYDRFLAEKKAEEERIAKEKDIASASIYDAFEMAKVFLKGKLKNPKSADFVRQRANDCVKDLGDGDILSTCMLMQPIPFGGTVRNRFSITLRYIGDDEWGCSSIVEQ